MPTSADRYAVDTSVAVAALDSVHTAHTPCRAVVIERRPALCGHAAFETYSVLTRMPRSLAPDSRTAADVIGRLFPTVCSLADADELELLDRFGTIGITGGAVYDALVGEAARIDRRTLLTRDQRARRTYDLLGVAYELVG